MNTPPNLAQIIGDALQSAWDAQCAKTGFTPLCFASDPGTSIIADFRGSEFASQVANIVSNQLSQPSAEPSNQPAHPAE